MGTQPSLEAPKVCVCLNIEAMDETVEFTSVC
jgi:hypothetical protein